MRFCLDDDEDWKKRDRRRDDFDERREENLTLLDEETEEEDAQTRFFLSKSRSLAKEKITTGTLVGVCVRACKSK